MSLEHTSDFDRSRRTLFFEYHEMPRRIGTVELGEPKGRGKLPVLLPYSKVVDPDQTVYLESHGFHAKWSSAGNFEGVVFVAPLWGEVESIVQSPTNAAVAAGDAPAGTNKLEGTGTLDLHKFGQV